MFRSIYPKYKLTPCAAKELAFAVPNNKLQQAVASLVLQGFSVCRNVDCPVTRQTKWEISFRNPSVHFHMDWTKPSCQEQWLFDRDNTLQLFAMEDVLWELPTCKGLGFIDGQFNNIISASDPCLRWGSELQGWGRFPDPHTDVRIPTWQRYFEALILNSLSCRRRRGWESEYSSELDLVQDRGGPHHLCHPDFEMFFPDTPREPGPYKHVWAKAMEILGPRLLGTRPPPPHFPH